LARSTADCKDHLVARSLAKRQRWDELDAIAAYRRIPRSADLDGAFALAQRRLGRLGARP
jgi:hypothetical protein